MERRTGLMEAVSRSPAAPERDRHRVCSEAGFGLIELLIALTLVAVGIGADAERLRELDREPAARRAAGYRAEPRRPPARGVPVDVLLRACRSASPPGSRLQPMRVSTRRAGRRSTHPDPRDPSNPTPFPNPYAATQTVPTGVSPDHRSYTVTTTVTANAGSCGGSGTTLIAVTRDHGWDRPDARDRVEVLLERRHSAE